VIALDEEARDLMAMNQVDADGDDAVGGLQRVELGLERPGLISISRGAPWAALLPRPSPDRS
jgi:hypothetical protein